MHVCYYVDVLSIMRGRGPIILWALAYYDWAGFSNVQMCIAGLGLGLIWAHLDHLGLVPGLSKLVLSRRLAPRAH